MVEAFTAAAIAKLAFDGVIQAGAGNLTETAISKAKLLWQKIREKFKGNPIAEEALRDAEEQRALEILEQEVVPLLQVAMRKDTQFAQEIQNIAQQINQEITSNGQKHITMSDFETHDNSVVIQNLEGQVESLGGTHVQKKS